LIEIIFLPHSDILTHVLKQFKWRWDLCVRKTLF
jgi:hypothetical protein